MANRLSNPLTFVASLENFWPNASERLWAGSVDCGMYTIQCTDLAWLRIRTMRRTDWRHLASWMASEHDVVVFPKVQYNYQTESQYRMTRTYQHHLSLLRMQTRRAGIRQRAMKQSTRRNRPQNIHFNECWSNMF
jgi:hypothetical protein